MKSKKKIFSDPSFMTDEPMDIVIPILTDCDNDDDFSEGIDKQITEVPILPLRNMVLFPGVALPVMIGRTKSMNLIKDKANSKAMIGVVCQRDMEVDEPKQEDLYTVGVIADVLRVLDMSDGMTTVLLQGRKRFELQELTQDEPYLKGRISFIDEQVPENPDREFKAVMSNIKDLMIKIMMATNELAKRELAHAIKNNNNALYLVSYASANQLNDVADKQMLLATNNLKDRAYKLLTLLNKEFQMIELKASIQMKTQEDIDKQQKEYFLQQQIKTIQEELGGNTGDRDIQDLKEKAMTKKWPMAVAEIFDKELHKLQRLHPQSPDYSVQMQYVQTIVGLPWETYSTDNFNLNHARRILDRDHYGLEKVKERIIEHLAVLKLKKDIMKSPIICLYGPPGVGKTSLGHSIAEALGRKYVRVSLGGLHDEAEIRGHRRTYIGAMCGRILKNLQKAGTSNPVFILDEIDKVTNDFKGDPAAALLEVLDPEQNSTFHDNYLDIDYDLSHVMFIATANNLNTISQPLLDRMELIEVSGYIQEEKVEIAAKHLVPKEAEIHGLNKKDVKLPKKTIQAIIESYTRESGVRELDKKIAKLMRKLAFKKASDEALPSQIKPEDLHDYLGPVEYTRDKYQGNAYAGVVTGLAWTAVGGEILFVETSLSKGKGGKLTLTGNLGDVMKESAMLALEYIHAHAALFGIAEDMFENWNVHIHVPEGAIPKDGPSAGITMVTSLVSAFTQRKVKSNLAMTGEITLRGKVLPVGGIREKILAAKRAGINEIILCKENQKDIDEIKPEYLKGLTFHYVTDIQEVIKLALLDEKVENPLF